MIRLLIALAVALVVFPFSATPIAREDWPLARVNRSIGYLLTEHATNEAGETTYLQCSAIAIRKNLVYLTARHCLGPKMLMDEWLYVALDTEFPDSDLAVVRGTSDKRSSPLPLGPEPAPGAELLAIGFGLNSPVPLAFPGVFAANFTPPGGERAYQFMSERGLEGMSGGPVIDRKGRLVGVHLLGYEHVRVGGGPTYAEVKAAYTRTYR